MGTTTPPTRGLPTVMGSTGQRKKRKVDQGIAIIIIIKKKNNNDRNNNSDNNNKVDPGITGEKDRR